MPNLCRTPGILIVCMLTGPQMDPNIIPIAINFRARTNIFLHIWNLDVPRFTCDFIETGMHTTATKKQNI